MVNVQNSGPAISIRPQPCPEERSARTTFSEWHSDPFRLTFSLFVGFVYGYKLDEDKFNVSAYLTDPRYRGIGLGRKTWEALVERLGPSWNISLSAMHGTVAMYAKMGFNTIGPKYRTFSGVPDRTILLGELSEEVVVEELQKDCVDSLRDYDLKVSGVDRFALVSRYLTTCVGSVLVAKKSEQVLGYTTLDKRLHYHFIAPLYADNKNVAMALMRRLLQDVPATEPIAMAMFNDNQEANELRKDLGIHTVFANDSTMLTGKKYACQIDKVYSIVAGCYPVV